jgi:hypothetical protein
MQGGAVFGDDRVKLRPQPWIRGFQVVEDPAGNQRIIFRSARLALTAAMPVSARRSFSVSVPSKSSATALKNHMAHLLSLVTAGPGGWPGARQAEHWALDRGSSP